MFLSSVSDRAPVSVVMHARPQASDVARPCPLPRGVVSDPLHGNLVAEYEVLIGFSRHGAPAALDLAMLCRQAAGRACRGLQLEAQPRALQS